jgi:ABC-type glycerol-3-phosphate transport system substrate-binding protein
VIGASALSKQLDATIDWLFFVAGPTGQKEYQSRRLGLPVLRSMTTTPAWKQAPGVQLMQSFKPLARTALWRQLATDAFNPNINKLMNGQLTAQEACAAMDEVGSKDFASAALQSGSMTTTTK